MVVVCYNEWLGVWVSKIGTHRTYGKTPGHSILNLLIFRDSVLSYLEHRKINPRYDLLFKNGDIGFIDGKLLGWFKSGGFHHNKDGLIFKVDSFLPQHLVNISVKENIPLFTKYLDKYKEDII